MFRTFVPNQDDSNFIYLNRYKMDFLLSGTNLEDSKLGSSSGFFFRAVRCYFQK